MMLNIGSLELFCRIENKLTTEMDIYQDMPDDPATLTSQMFGMPCKLL